MFKQNINERENHRASNLPSLSESQSFLRSSSSPYLCLLRTDTICCFNAELCSPHALLRNKELAFHRRCVTVKLKNGRTVCLHSRRRSNCLSSCLHQTVQAELQLFIFRRKAGPPMKVKHKQTASEASWVCHMTSN